MSGPFRVAIVGSGPAGFYAAEHLQKHDEIAVEIDLFDRLPTPYGLVRLGVAPDHQKIKSVTKAYEKVAAHPAFRFYGGVELGRHVTAADLAALYHAVILTVGAPEDRAMGIPGEELANSLSATDFVAWYNAHPEHVDLDVDLSVTDAVVVGNGNVAVDVARILVTAPDVLAGTDIADHALERLRASRVRTVTMLGRRGPAQAAFTPKEIRELGELDGVTLVVDPEDLVLDPRSSELIDEHGERVLHALGEVAGRTPGPDDRVIRLRFLTSPTALVGDGTVRQVRTVLNELVEDRGTMRPRATEVTGSLPAGLVLRAVGYRGIAVPGYPFDERAAVIPNAAGRVVDPATGSPVPGCYVAGWIKRGPQGVIGTNKADAKETVTSLVEDLEAGLLNDKTDATAEAADALVRERVPQVWTWSDWRAIDRAEQDAGAPAGRPRRKFATIEEMREAANTATRPA